MIGPSLSVVHTVPSRRRKLAPALSSPPKQNVPSYSPGANHLKPTGTSSSCRPRLPHDPVDQAAADQRLAHGGRRRPVGAVRQQVADRHGEVVVGVHQPGGGRDDAVAVGVGVVAEGDVEPVLQLHQAGHRVGAGAVHADLAVVIDRHERRTSDRPSD